MLRIDLIVKNILICLLAGGVLTSAGCTRMPVDHASIKPEKVNAGKMHRVAESSIGATTRYIDSATGAAVEITVHSEYFSAAGRKCRRFSSRSHLSMLGKGANVDRGGSQVLDSTILEGGAKTGSERKNSAKKSAENSEAATSGLACEDSNSGWIEIPIHAIAG